MCVWWGVGLEVSVSGALNWEGGLVLALPRPEFSKHGTLKYQSPAVSVHLFISSFIHSPTHSLREGVCSWREGSWEGD